LPKPILIMIYIIAAIVIIMATVKYILPILLPFVIALIVSIIMEPVIEILQNRARFNRGMATMTSMFLVFGSIAIIFSIIILKLVTELLHLSLTLPSAAAELRLLYGDLIERLTAFYITLPPGVVSSLEQNITTLTTNLQGLISSLTDSIIRFLSLVPGTLTIIVVSILATYFVARDRHLISELLLKTIPAPWGEKTVTVIREITAAFTGYLKAQAILVSITTVLSVLGLLLIGANYSLTMGLLIGFFDIIQVLGPATIYIPWLIWSFATGATGMGIKLMVLYGLVLTVRQFSETKIVSVNLGLHPLATLIAMYAGLRTMGLVGLLMGPILLIALQAVIKTGVLGLGPKDRP
jgi:sporulation integral membrane protein YtvI